MSAESKANRTPTASCRRSTAGTSMKPTRKPASPNCCRAFPIARTTAARPAAGGFTAACFPNTTATAPANARDTTPIRCNPNWGFAWPHNRRILYNRASADPAGNPWSERKKLIWWDADKKKWEGDDEPDFEPDKAPDYRPTPDCKGMDAIGGAEPFIMKPDGRAWLWAPGGTKDGPLPAHYEPIESPVPNLLYPKYPDSPTVRYLGRPGQSDCAYADRRSTRLWPARSA